MWQAPDRDLDAVINKFQLLVTETESLVTDDKRHLARKSECVQVLRVGGLFQADELVAVLTKLFQYRRQRATDFDLDVVGAVPRNPAINSSIATSDDRTDTAAARRPDNARQVGAAAKGGAGEYKIAVSVKRSRRSMSEMLEHDQQL